MKIDVLLLPGFSYKQSYYNQLINTCPKDWKFHKLNYYEIINKNNTFNFAERINSFLKKREIQKINIIAHSLGGVFAINFANQYPEKVNHLYLLNTLGVEKKVLLRNFILLVLKNKRYDYRKHLNDDLKGIVNILLNPFLHLKLLSYVKSHELEKQAANLKVKTTIIWGDKDYLLPTGDARKLNKLIYGSKLIVLKGLGHDWPLHSSELFWNNI